MNTSRSLFLDENQWKPLISVADNVKNRYFADHNFALLLSLRFASSPKDRGKGFKHELNNVSNADLS